MIEVLIQSLRSKIARLILNHHPVVILYRNDEFYFISKKSVNLVLFFFYYLFNMTSYVELKIYLIHISNAFCDILIKNWVCYCFIFQLESHVFSRQKNITTIENSFTSQIGPVRPYKQTTNCTAKILINGIEFDDLRGERRPVLTQLSQPPPPHEKPQLTSTPTRPQTPQLVSIYR